MDADGLARPAKAGQVLVDKHGAPGVVKAPVGAVDEVLDPGEPGRMIDPRWTDRSTRFFRAWSLMMRSPLPTTDQSAASLLPEHPQIVTEFHTGREWEDRLQLCLSEALRN